MMRPYGEDLLDVGLDLLDRQIDDAHGRHLGKVDDLALIELGDGTVIVDALLSGPGALAPRLGGALGSACHAIWRRLHPDAEPEVIRTPMALVAEIGPRVRLVVPADQLSFDRTERWVREHLIDAIPGAARAPG